MICPKCGKEAGESKFCQSCGAALTETAPSVSPEAVDGKKMTVCKACGAQMAKSAKTCPSCGAKNKKPIYKRWWLWALIAFALIVVIAAAGSGDEKAPNAGEGTTVAEQKDAPSETKATTAAPSTTEDASITLGMKNALAKAKSYLSFDGFSKKGLMDQLAFEGFSEEEAAYAVEACGADWNEQAAKKAKSYMSFSSFSKTGLIEQLEFEGFTHEQAVYGAEAVGY